jgi:6,7-dimethyl-8-ribityllumazine synthase
MSENRLSGPDLSRNAYCKRIAIVKTRWQPHILKPVYEGVRTGLKECGVKDSQIFEMTVPSPFDLPHAVRQSTQGSHVIIVISTMVDNEIRYQKYMHQTVMNGLMDVSMLCKPLCVLPLVVSICSTTVHIHISTLYTHGQVQLKTYRPVICGLFRDGYDPVQLTKQGVQWGRDEIEMLNPSCGMAEERD